MTDDASIGGALVNAEAGPAASRVLPVRSAMGYVRENSVPPGGSVRFCVSSPAAYRLEVVRLARAPIAALDADADRDRSSSELCASFERETAAPRTIRPGSYVHVCGPPLPAGPLTCGLWLRPWRLPVLDQTQWAWSGLITDLDYPTAARYALLVDHLGRVGVYLGDRSRPGGGAFDHERLAWSEPLMAQRLGTWLHVVASIGHAGTAIIIDGREVLRRPPADGHGDVIPAPGPRSRLRIGASMEGGLVDDFLDADIAAPFVAAGELDSPSLAGVVEDRARTPLGSLGLGPLHGAWDLAEDHADRVADTSGAGRHGLIVQAGTWQIGGPAFDASRGGADYDPAHDRDRGHGLRLSSDDLIGCGWPVSEAWEVPADAASGIYAGIVHLAGADEHDAPVITFAVTRRAGHVASTASPCCWPPARGTPMDVARRPRPRPSA